MTDGVYLYNRYKRKLRLLDDKFLLIGLLYLLFVLCYMGKWFTERTANEALKKVSEPHFIAESYGTDYCVYPNVFKVGSSIPCNDRDALEDAVTLILHVSADYLCEGIMEQVSNWKAPVSLSVFFDDPASQIPCVEALLRHFEVMVPQDAALLSVHYFFRSSHCNETFAFDTLCRRGKQPKALCQRASYPINVARNIARKYATTSFVVSADYGHLFSDGFERSMLQLAKRELSIDKKALLVYRVFEVDSRSESPHNKSDLSKLISSENAVVFHELSHPGGHSIAGLEDWLVKDSSQGDGIFERNVVYDRGSWEPQFVSSSTIPLHDESFPYPVKDNTCLRWELCRAGYKLHVVDDHFMFHKGIKNNEDWEYWNALRYLNKEKFLEAHRNFTIRMNREYPLTADSCPEFTSPFDYKAPTMKPRSSLFTAHKRPPTVVNRRPLLNRWRNEPKILNSDGQLKSNVENRKREMREVLRKRFPSLYRGH